MKVDKVVTEVWFQLYDIWSASKRLGHVYLIEEMSDLSFEFVEGTELDIATGFAEHSE
jgi:hypothetical protein